MESGGRRDGLIDTVCSRRRGGDSLRLEVAATDAEPQKRFTQPMKCNHHR